MVYFISFICNHKLIQIFWAVTPLPSRQNFPKTISPCIFLNFFFYCKEQKKSKCKRMTDAMLNNAKKCLKNLIQCEELYMCEDPMGAFSEAILNYHNHHQDIHTSEWCRFHRKVRHNYVYSKLEKLLTKKLYQVSISF